MARQAVINIVETKLGMVRTIDEQGLLFHLNKQDVEYLRRLT